MSTPSRRPLAAALPVLAALAALALASCARTPVMQGEVEATQVDVAAKIAGRVESVMVARGDHVTRGQVLATLDTPEIRAKMTQATSAARAASAQERKALGGAREEEVRGAEAQWERARAAAVLAESTYRRVERLHRDGVVATQRRDEAETNWSTARDAERAARAVYDMAHHGARAEDRDAASALASQAAGVVSEVGAYLDESRLRAPLDGEVAELVTDPGELVSPGYPVLTLVDLADTWVTFQVREDLLHGVRIGTPLPVRIPALGAKDVPYRVTYIAPMGDFATWRSTQATGEFDLKTFEVRARPVRPLDGLRPGMSALARWPKAR